MTSSYNSKRIDLSFLVGSVEYAGGGTDQLIVPHSMEI